MNLKPWPKLLDHYISAKGKRGSKLFKVVDSLYQKPVIDVQRVSEVSEVSLATAYKIVAELEKLGILTEITGSKRGKLYIYTEYIKLFKPNRKQLI